MPSLDIAMPIALFVVIVVSLFLNKRVQGKLMASVEEKQFQTKDIILLVCFYGYYYFSYSIYNSN